MEALRFCSSEFIVRITAVSAALAMAAMFAPASLDAAGVSAAPSPAPAEITAESACASIQQSLDELARAERDQAFSLSLASGGGPSTLVETKLSALLDRTNRLRSALRAARQSRVGRDPRVDQCIAMGFGALGDAERLTTDVEEMLYQPNASRARPGSPVTPGAPAPQR